MNQSGGFSEALLKGVAEIVSGVGGDDEDGGSNPSETNREDGTACGLPNASFPTHEYPF